MQTNKKSEERKRLAGEDKKSEKEENKPPRKKDRKPERSYFDRPQTHRGNNSSKGDFEKVENLFFDVGYWSTRGSIDLAIGMVAGLLAGIKDLVFGSLEAAKNSKNSIIESQSKQALLNSATNDLSNEDKESLSQGIKISDDEYRTTATLVDDLYKNNEILKNNSGSIEYGEYTFNKTELENGNQQYFISKNTPGSNIKVETFILDKDRNVVTTSNTFSKEDNKDSLDLISSITQNSNVLESNRSTNSQPIIANEDLIEEIIFKAEALNQAIEATKIGEGDTNQERLDIKKSLIEKEGALIELEIEINQLSGAIENEVAQNSSSEGTSQGVIVSLEKLKGMTEAVSNTRQNLASKQNSANSLNASTVVNEVESEIEESKSIEPLTAENNSSTSQTEGKTIINTTPSVNSYEVDEDEVELNYSPDM